MMYRQLCRRIALVFCISLLPTLIAAGNAEAQTDERCFAETGFCISGRIRTFWGQNGGLSIFGFPIAPQQEEMVEGRPFQVQWFERARLELHPENPQPYDVLLGRVGVQHLNQQGRDWFQFPQSTPQANCRFFSETGHNICGDILRAWRASGLEIDRRRGKTEAENLALFGLPISDAQTENIGGHEYTVQWFERGRFELHPENNPPYNVLLGLLGSEIRAEQTAAAAPISDVCSDIPAPISASIQPGTCITLGTAIAIDIFGFQSHERVASWLTAPSGQVARTDQATTDRHGDKSGLAFETRDLSPGLWFWAFQGTKSGHSAVVYFKMLGNGAPPPPPGNYHINWGASQNVSDPNVKSFSPSAIIDSNNNTHIVYQTADGALWYTNNVAGSFAPPEVIQPKLGLDHGLGSMLALGPNNTLHLLYAWDSRDKQLYYRQATLDGATAHWSGPEKISNMGDKAADPALVVDGAGNVHFAWSAHCPDSLIYNVFYRIRYPDGSLSHTSAISPDCRIMEHRPLLALTNNGTLHAVFAYGDEVAYARREGNDWSTRTISESPGVISKNEAIATDGSAIYVAWDEDVHNHDVLFRSSADGGQTWSKITALSNTPALARFPSATYSATSRRVYIVWVDATGSAGDRTDIWYQAIDPAGGAAAASTRLTNIRSNLLVPSILVGPAKVAVVWQDNSRGRWQIFQLGGMLASD